jgi:hypothetical protein
MKFRCQVLRGLPVVMRMRGGSKRHRPARAPFRRREIAMNLRVFGLPAVVAFAIAAVLGSAPAEAQFTQQGPKLVGTGAELSTPAQGWSISLSDDGNTVSVSSISSGAWIFARTDDV